MEDLTNMKQRAMKAVFNVVVVLEVVSIFGVPAYAAAVEALSTNYKLRKPEYSRVLVVFRG